MGCLFEILLEILLEGILSLVMFIYMKLACVCVPNKKITKETEKKVQKIITTISALLVLTLFIGLIFLFAGDTKFNVIGKFMTFIPLSILVLQIVLNIVIMIVKFVKRDKK